MKNNVLIAPNAYKHSLSAIDAAQAIKEGFESVDWEGDLCCLPIGDGGTGTGEILMLALNAKIIKTPVENLLGRVQMVSWGWVEDTRTAIIDLASVNGIDKISDEERDPLHFTTYGTGQLIKAAIEHQAKEILLCVGGSATIDGGIGVAQALGIKFTDHKGSEILYPKDLIHLAEIDFSNVYKPVKNCTIKVLCDVQNPLLGESNAIEMYGPQKGADKNIQDQLMRALKKFNQVLEKNQLGKLEELAMGGAAGGIAGGLHVLFNAELLNGFEVVYEYLGIQDLFSNYGILITGEGKLDAQSLQGKAPYAIATKAKEFNLFTIVIAGGIEEGFEELAHPFDRIEKIKGEVDFKNTAANLKAWASNIAIELKDRLWKH